MRYRFLGLGLLLASLAVQAQRVDSVRVKELPDRSIKVQTAEDQPLTVEMAKDQTVTVKIDSAKPIKIAQDDGLLAPGTVIAVLSLIVAGISWYTAYQSHHLAQQSSRDQARSFQLTLADSAYKNVRDSHAVYNAAAPEDATDAANVLMRDLEYLALLINAGDISDKNVVQHFKKQLRAWHDGFLPNFDDWATNDKRLPELKKLVKTMTDRS